MESLSCTLLTRKFIMEHKLFVFTSTTLLLLSIYRYIRGPFSTDKFDRVILDLQLKTMNNRFVRLLLVAHS